MTSALQTALIAALAVAGACWILSLLTRDVSWVDRIWSLAPVGYVAWFASRARFRLLRDRGVFAALETPEAALAHSYTEAETARMAEYRNSAFVGTAAQVVERIEELAKRLNVQEMAVVTWATDEAVRRKSYTLLAQAMGFAP